MTKARDIANLGDSLINDADDNVALGDGALDSQTTGANNVAIGESALASNTSASNNTAVGYQAGYSNTTGVNTFVGAYVGKDTTTGTANIGVGGEVSGVYTTLRYNSTGSSNSALGIGALANNTTASNNTAVGYQAGYSNTTGIRGVFIGERAGYSNTTGNENTIIGRYAGYNVIGSQNLFLGEETGFSQSSGSFNTYVGTYAGSNMTTGSKNTIVGKFNGNEGGLDIRTSSNNIVLSDGDGNPRQLINNGYHGEGSLHLGNYIGSGLYDDPGFNNQYGVTFRRLKSTHPALMVNSQGRHYFYKVTTGDNAFIEFSYKSTLTTGGTGVGTITTNGSSTSYNTTSDYRLKENVVELTGATDRLKQLEPKRFNFIADADTTVDGFLAHEVQTIVPEAINGEKDAVDADGNPVYQGIDQSKLVPLLVATIKELEARITALEAN